MCTGQAGGPGNFESQFNSPQYGTPLGGGGQPGANTSGYGSMGQGMQSRIAPQQPGGGQMDFAQFMQSPQGQAVIQQLRSRMGGGMQQGGPQPGGMHGGLLGQPGVGMRPMAPVQPPAQGLPPGVSMGLTPPNQANPYANQRGITAPILPPGSMGVRGLR